MTPISPTKGKGRRCCTQFKYLCWDSTRNYSLKSWLLQGQMLLDFKKSYSKRPTEKSRASGDYQLVWMEVLFYLSYSPDLAPSDFHLFGGLQRVYRRSKFTSDKEMKNTVSDWFKV